jgi:hypothetical protein
MMKRSPLLLYVALALANHAHAACALDPHDGAVTVQECGAKCDGTTDDTAAIRAADTAAAVVGRVRFLPGTGSSKCCIVSDSIAVQSLAWEGISPLYSCVKSTAPTKSVMTRNDINGGVSFFTLENMRIQGGLRGFDGTSATQVADRNLVIRNDQFIQQADSGVALEDPLNTVIGPNVRFDDEPIGVRAHYAAGDFLASLTLRDFTYAENGCTTTPSAVVLAEWVGQNASNAGSVTIEGGRVELNCHNSGVFGILHALTGGPNENILRALFSGVVFDDATSNNKSFFVALERGSGGSVDFLPYTILNSTLAGVMGLDNHLDANSGWRTDFPKDLPQIPPDGKIGFVSVGSTSQFGSLVARGPWSSPFFVEPISVAQQGDTGVRVALQAYGTVSFGDGSSSNRSLFESPSGAACEWFQGTFYHLTGTPGTCP